MVYFFDENFDDSIPNALNLIESSEGNHSVLSTREEFGAGIKDPKLIALIAKKKGVLITFDRKALKQHIKLLKRHKVPVFAYSYGSKPHREKVHLIMSTWYKVREISEEKKKEKKYPTSLRFPIMVFWNGLSLFFLI